MTTAITYEQEEAPLYIVEEIFGRMEHDLEISRRGGYRPTGYSLGHTSKTKRSSTPFWIL